MYQIQLKFKGQNKKITVAKSLQTSELQRLIAQCFCINERVVGVTNKSGCFLELSEFNKTIASSPKETFALVTAKDLNQDSMSFGNLPIIQPLSTIKECPTRPSRRPNYQWPSQQPFPPHALAPYPIFNSSKSFAWERKE